MQEVMQEVFDKLRTLPEARLGQQEYWGRPVLGPVPAPVRQPRETGWEVLS